MSKVNLPKGFGTFPDDKKPAWIIERNAGYADGLRDGAKRERRAVKKWVGFNTNIEVSDYDALCDWLTARAKKEKP